MDEATFTSRLTLGLVVMLTAVMLIGGYLVVSRLENVADKVAAQGVEIAEIKAGQIAGNAAADTLTMAVAAVDSITKRTEYYARIAAIVAGHNPNYLPPTRVTPENRSRFANK